MDAPPALRKQLLSGSIVDTRESMHVDEIEVAARATVHYSSEDPAHPVEHMFDHSSGKGATRWTSARANVTEEILLAFDEPQRITRIVFEAEERLVERTQEIRAEFSTDGGRTYRQAFVQEYNFSPQGSTYQREQLNCILLGVTNLRLIIVPNKRGSGYATLTSLRLFA